MENLQIWMQGEMDEGKKIARQFFLLTIFPVLAIILVFYFLTLLHQKTISNSVEQLSTSQGRTIQMVLSVAGGNLVEGSESKLIDFLTVLLKKTGALYFAVFKNDKLYYWDSRFEGYLPVERGKKSPRIFKSPEGSILELKSGFKNSQGDNFEVFVGYDFTVMDILRHNQKRTFIFIFVVFIVFSSALFVAVVRINKFFVEKEKELLKLQQEKKRFRELSLLAGAISHELKNPVNSLYLSIQVMGEELRGKEEYEKFVKPIKMEIRRLADIIDNHLAIMRLKPRIEKINITETIKEVISDFSKENVNIEIFSPAEFVCFSDRKLLKMVFSNILRNSVEAGSKNILIGCEKKGNEVEIFVKDDGQGLALEADEVFKPYVTTKREGTGIGLALVERIIDALGGKIKLERIKPHGLIVRIVLRCEK